MQSIRTLLRTMRYSVLNECGFILKTGLSIRATALMMDQKNILYYQPMV